MREQLEQRLKELREEFGNGERMLADLQTQFENVKVTTLRIAGAIQVLEEELGRNNQSVTTVKPPLGRKIPNGEDVGQPS
jgi:hypothetical protein